MASVRLDAVQTIAPSCVSWQSVCDLLTCLILDSLRGLRVYTADAQHAVYMAYAMTALQTLCLTGNTSNQDFLECWPHRHD